MSALPWFAFNIKDYLSDTMRLTTEAHGAYLLLILDYYESEGPSPDDDFILAAITKLPIEQWKKHRKVLERFFQIREGHWFHDRIEREMREASARHAASKEQARAAALAMHAARREKQAKTGGKQPKSAPRTARAHAPAVQPAVPEQSVEHVHLTPSYNRGGGEPPAPQAVDEGLGSPVDRGFTPDPATSDRARAAGMTIDEIDAEVRKFIATKLDQGAFSHDWQGSFALWIEREIAHRAKTRPKAPPRIEVNNQPAEIPEAEWDRAVAAWKRDNSRWSRHLGSEPGMGGCRVPRAILEKHGIDPKTGMPVRKAS